MHIALWLDSESAIGWGQSPDFPYREGSFFGNLFPSPWSGYYCNGADYASGEVPGRLGSPMTSSVYVNPYGANAPCAATCTAHGADGFDSCPDTVTAGHRWNHVVSVWRNFDAGTAYKICNKQSGKCLGVVSASTVDGAKVEQRTYAGAAGQTWAILQVAPGKYRIVNVNSGRAMDVSGNQMIQKAYVGSPTQQSAVASLADQTGFALIKPSSSTTSAFSVATTSDGAIAQLTTNLTMDFAKWNMVGVGSLPAGWSPK